MFLPANNMRIHRKRKKPIKTRRRSWQWKLRPLLVVSTLSMTCTTRFHHAVPMDTDSEAIGIDNRAIRWLGRYLRQTKDKGMILRPDRSKGLELFVDADFAGN